MILEDDGYRTYNEVLLIVCRRASLKTVQYLAALKEYVATLETVHEDGEGE